jgi:hypothetical protein
VGDLCPSEQSALVGRRGPQELLIGKRVPGSTVPAVHRGLQRLLISTYVPGSIFLAMSLRMLIISLRSGEHCAPWDVGLPEAYAPT